MTESRLRPTPSSRQLPKAPTGIAGLDQITGGGLPRGRPTLVCGSAGCGKTLLAMEFLVRGATDYGEPGVFVAFEEPAEELTENVRSLGFDLDRLVDEQRIGIDYIRIDPGEIEETGAFDLEGLFIRLGVAIDAINAKRVVLDTIETLFGSISNAAILRAELVRLFRWLKDRGVTAIVTGERGEGQLTRHGLEEYVSDCVIQLDHRVSGQMSTRRLRIVKYRGTAHESNEYPFLIDETGIWLSPVTSTGLEHAASDERISSGVPGLDEMLGGLGFHRGASVLISGTAGTGKTSLAAHFADAACRRGERCVYLAFEESERQVARNMRSIGIKLDPWIRKGLLVFHAARPALMGLEAHLLAVHNVVTRYKPSVVIVDPLNSFRTAGTPEQMYPMLVRLIDFLKAGGITALFVNVSPGGTDVESSDLEISSLIDTWLLVRNIERAGWGERNRALQVLKSRGMAHSNQVRELILSDRGVQLVDVVQGRDGVLIGGARRAQQVPDRSARADHKSAARGNGKRKRKARPSGAHQRRVQGA